ncbi:hypothetical protein D3C87_1486080 [compost metagenome]
MPADRAGETPLPPRYLHHLWRLTAELFVDPPRQDWHPASEGFRPPRFHGRPRPSHHGLYPGEWPSLRQPPHHLPEFSVHYPFCTDTRLPG